MVAIKSRGVQSKANLISAQEEWAQGQHNLVKKDRCVVHGSPTQKHINTSLCHITKITHQMNLNQSTSSTNQGTSYIFLHNHPLSSWKRKNLNLNRSTSSTTTSSHHGMPHNHPLLLWDIPHSPLHMSTYSFSCNVCFFYQSIKYSGN